jgi:hypothetical protein
LQFEEGQLRKTLERAKEEEVESFRAEKDVIAFLFSDKLAGCSWRTENYVKSLICCSVDWRRPKTAMVAWYRPYPNVSRTQWRSCRE